MKMQSARLDIWLWRARFFKTRSLAALTIRRGKIRISRHNEEMSVVRLRKPHTQIRAGDTLIFMQGQTLRHLLVQDVGHRRGPVSEAQTLYSPLEDVANLPISA
jgi:ribosome-associated heat shock protein Hsp15